MTPWYRCLATFTDQPPRGHDHERPDMARTRTAPGTTTTAPAPAEAPAQEESTMSTDTTTTTAPDTTDEVGVSTTTEEAPKVDTFAEFTTALTTALDAATEADGVTDAIAAPVVTAYRALKGKARDKAAAHVAEIMNAKIGAGDLGTLGHVAALQQAYTAPSVAAPKEKAPVDPKEAFVNKVTPLIAAVRLVTDDYTTAGGNLDEVDLDGVAEMIVGHVRAFLTERPEGTEAPAMSAYDTAALKIYQGKAPGAKGTKGTSTRAPGAPRGNVDSHIAHVLDQAPDGATLTVADIVREGSDEYPAGTASQGAISNGVKRLGTKEGSGYVALGGPAKLGGVEGPLSIRKG